MYNVCRAVDNAHRSLKSFAWVRQRNRPGIIRYGLLYAIGLDYDMEGCIYT